MQVGKPVVALFGPTAVGKTELSIEIAERLGAEIVSVDSRQIYRSMDIGTAKPSLAQRARVRHHLIDIADPQERWTLAQFRESALAAIGDIHARGCLALLVGGTGQYFKALFEGWLPPPTSEDPALRAQWESYAEQHGSEALHRKLQEIDPQSAQRIDHRNIRRVVRALEIHHLTGRQPSRVRKKRQPDFHILRIGLTLPRTELYARIDHRIDAMIDAGLVQEVAGLMARGLTIENSAMSGIGYRQIARHLKGDASLQEAIQQIRKRTREFVRRQANWFKADDPAIHWFEARPGVEKIIIETIQGWLARSESMRNGGSRNR